MKPEELKYFTQICNKSWGSKPTLVPKFFHLSQYTLEHICFILLIWFLFCLHNKSKSLAQNNNIHLPLESAILAASAGTASWSLPPLGELPTWAEIHFLDSVSSLLVRWCCCWLPSQGFLHGMPGFQRTRASKTRKWRWAVSKSLGPETGAMPFLPYSIGQQQFESSDSRRKVTDATSQGDVCQKT